MSDRFRCEQHMRNCVDRCPDCDRAEIERLRARIADLEEQLLRALGERRALEGE